MKATLGRKLDILRSLAAQIPKELPIADELSRFCTYCQDNLVSRNSPVHSTYIINGDGIVKWDPRRGPKSVIPEEIEKSAEALDGLKRKALEYGVDLLALREAGDLVGEFKVPPRPKRQQAVDYRACDAGMKKGRPVARAALIFGAGLATAAALFSRRRA